MSSRTTNGLWSDRAYGPLLAPKKDDQGPRAMELVRRKALEDRAEESRLVYVATTRARDRLVLVGLAEGANSYGFWLNKGVEPHHIQPTTIKEGPVSETTPNRVALTWLDAVKTEKPDGLIAPLAPPPLSYIRSATDLMMHHNDPEEWERRYRHGVIAPWYFAKEAREDGGVPGTVRGTVIHGVLERIEQERELARILDEVIGGLDEPELAPLMAPRTAYRDALEDEIRRVVASDEWKWYVEGEHYRELPFAHLADVHEWRIGAMDLYRPSDNSLVIDFKTHEVDADEAVKVAQDYGIQARVYLGAATMRSKASVRFFFTSPGAEVSAVTQ
jgi:hypothetical protein